MSHEPGPGGVNVSGGLAGVVTDVPSRRNIQSCVRSGRMTWLDVLGWIGSAVLVWSLLQARQLRFRALNLAACVILIAFNWALGVWPQAAMNVVLAGINI